MAKNGEKRFYLRKILFITFTGDNVTDPKYAGIAEAGVRLQHQASKSGFFVESLCLNWSDLVEYARKHKHPIPNVNLKYLFTPYIALMIGETMYKQYDFIFYASAGCEINGNFVARYDLEKIIRLSKENGIYVEGTRYRERSWSKAELVNFVKATNQQLDTGQVMATFFIVAPVSNNWKRVKLMLLEWFNIATFNDFEFIKDDYDGNLQDSLFIAHRNDQSILSLLVKKHKLFIASEKRRGFGKPIPEIRGGATFLWVSRNRTGISRLPKNLENPFNQILSILLCPLFLIHTYLQDLFSYRIQYQNYNSKTITRRSNGK